MMVYFKLFGFFFLMRKHFIPHHRPTRTQASINRTLKQKEQNSYATLSLTGSTNRHLARNNEENTGIISRRSDQSAQYKSMKRAQKSISIGKNTTHKGGCLMHINNYNCLTQH